MRRIALFMSVCLLFMPIGAIFAEKDADSTGVRKAGAAADSAAMEDPSAWTRPAFSYDPGGKRDPFESLVSEEKPDEQKIKGLFNYEKAVLRGIVNAGDGAYALVVDADNYAYVLRQNDPVYGGRVTKITGDAVYLHTVQYGRSMSIVLRMDTERKTVRSDRGGEEVVRRPGITVSYGSGGTGGKDISVEDVVLPSSGVLMVEESWFGTSARPAAGLRGAHILIGPANRSSIRLPELLRWTKAADDSVYTVTVSRSADFSRPVLVRDGLTVPSFLLDGNSGLSGGQTLYWKVTATERSGKRADSRNNLSFTIVQ